MEAMVSPWVRRAAGHAIHGTIVWLALRKKKGAGVTRKYFSPAADGAVGLSSYNDMRMAGGVRGQEGTRLP